MNKIWNKIRKIHGRYRMVKAPVLTDRNTLVADPYLVGNMFGEALSAVSEGSKDPSFLRRKRIKEAFLIRFPDDDDEEYNQPFTTAEFEHAIRNCKNTSPGADKIHYAMLNHLPDNTRSFMIGLFNRIWQEDEFPVMWSATVLLSFLKPEKMGNVPLDYRPITLTSCLCKIFEKMINYRLMWALESMSVLHPNQYGFRRCRSTVDSLARLDDYIKIAFARKQHAVAVFFDLEKAYDTTWCYHILETLKDAGFRGHLPKFIQGFLSDRRFTVKIGSTFSDEYIQHEGVPQGSVLSCTLFALAVNDLPSSVPDGVESFLYVVDFALVTASSCLASAERRLQLAVGRAHRWATAHGFKFSPQKTVAMHFTKKRGLFPPLDLSLGRDHIREVSETRFLGMILDSKLTWIPHLKYVKHKCLRSLNLLKCISKKSWGADRRSLLRIYRATVRSQLDYGCQIYASATATSLKMLNSIHHLCIRRRALCAESGEPSLYYRRDLLSLQMYTSF